MSWFEDGDGVIRQVEGDNESSVNIFRNTCIESSSESEDLLVIVYIFEEISFGLVWQKFVDITERVDLITKAIVRRDLKRLGFTRFRVLNASNIKELVVLGFIELMSEFIYSSDSENSTESINSSLGFDFIASQIVISNEVLTRLVYCKALRKLLSL